MNLKRKPITFRERLLVIDIVAYGKQDTVFYFDTTLEQASNQIWKEVCPTAQILFAYDIALDQEDRIQLKIKKHKLTDDELAKINKQF